MDNIFNNNINHCMSTGFKADNVNDSGTSDERTI